MKIAEYTIGLNQQYEYVHIEAWQRGDSLCLYVWPLTTLDAVADTGVMVDWAGPDQYFAAGMIGDVYEWPEVCTVVPEPGLALSLIVGIVVLKVMNACKIQR